MANISIDVGKFFTFFRLLSLLNSFRFTVCLISFSFEAICYQFKDTKLRFFFFFCFVMRFLIWFCCAESVKYVGRLRVMLLEVLRWRLRKAGMKQMV